MWLGGSEPDRGAETHFSHFISNRIHGDAFNFEYNFLDPKPVPGSLTSAQSKKQMNRMRNILLKHWRSRIAVCCPFLNPGNPWKNVDVGSRKSGGHFDCKYYGRNNRKTPQNPSASFWISNLHDSF